MLRAVPSIMSIALSRLTPSRSLSLTSAISRTWDLVILPTLVRFGSALPRGSPAAFLIKSPAGGVLVIKVKEPSVKMVISTGMTCPMALAVRAEEKSAKQIYLSVCELSFRGELSELVDSEKGWKTGDPEFDAILRSLFDFPDPAMDLSLLHISEPTRPS
mgnify:CR=1 FL=1